MAFADPSYWRDCSFSVFYLSSAMMGINLAAEILLLVYFSCLFFLLLLFIFWLGL